MSRTLHVVALIATTLMTACNRAPALFFSPSTSVMVGFGSEAPDRSIAKSESMFQSESPSGLCVNFRR